MHHARVIGEDQPGIPYQAGRLADGGFSGQVQYMVTHQPVYFAAHGCFTISAHQNHRIVNAFADFSHPAGRKLFGGISAADDDGYIPLPVPLRKKGVIILLSRRNKIVEPFAVRRPPGTVTGC